MNTKVDYSKDYRGEDQSVKFSSIEVNGTEETPDTTTVKVLSKNNGYVFQCTAETLPADGETGFAEGCELVLINKSLNDDVVYVNVGDHESARFLPAAPPEVPTTGYVIVRDFGDFPTDIAGVITLEANTVYQIVGEIDLFGNRLVGSANSALVGFTPEVARIKSSTLDANTALITSEWTLPINNISLEHETILDLDATANPNQAIDWTGVNFVNATNSIGTITNYGNAIIKLAGFLNSGGLNFDGTIGTIAFTDSLFECAPGLTMINIPETCTISRRLRIDNSAFVILSGETGINISENAGVPIEGYILRNCNFGGGGTYIEGVNYQDNKARWEGNRGIDNSGNIGQYYMSDNATVTTITATDTFVKVLGDTTAGNFVEKFDVDTVDNRAEYLGQLKGFYKVSAIASLSAANNKTCALRIAKNGITIESSETRSATNGNGRSESIICQDIVELENADYLELFVANTTDTNNITVTELNFIVERIN